MGHTYVFEFQLSRRSKFSCERWTTYCYLSGKFVYSLILDFVTVWGWQPSQNQTALGCSQLSYGGLFELILSCSISDLKGKLF